MSRGPDPGTALVRALEANARRAGCPVRMSASDWTRWASATFTGARHELTVEADESGALDNWLTELPEAELPIRGHLVADIIVASVRRGEGVATILLEALTVEE
jgi:GNAT superfamily N-acetyltransferase